ncbi:hypothetical protein BJ508DRAFT_44014, partial [Ascobolus immersus RN42]
SAATNHLNSHLHHLFHHKPPSPTFPPTPTSCRAMEYGYTPPAPSAGASFSGSYNPTPVPGYFPAAAGPSSSSRPSNLVPSAGATASINISTGPTPPPSYMDLTPTPTYPPLTPTSLKARLADYLTLYIHLRSEAIKRRLPVQYQIYGSPMRDRDLEESELGTDVETRRKSSAEVQAEYERVRKELTRGVLDLQDVVEDYVDSYKRGRFLVWVSAVAIAISLRNLSFYKLLRLLRIRVTSPQKQKPVNFLLSSLLASSFILLNEWKISMGRDASSHLAQLRENVKNGRKVSRKDIEWVGPKMKWNGVFLEEEGEEMSGDDRRERRRKSRVSRRRWGEEQEGERKNVGVMKALGHAGGWV